MFYAYDAIFRCCAILHRLTGALHRATDRLTLRVQVWAIRRARECPQYYANEDTA